MQPEKCINTYDETYVSRPLKVIIHNEQLSGLEGVAFQAILHPVFILKYC